ncbi:UDP-glucosyltransferase 2-like [Schistocerca americana]|uniref:UDP-glucosyltransferase 2-like n=1 Tax=Schistocerca americana TaxID=7009 RepID=UPI001F500897|nr:UDP-glucosyltransferase 2-like [Schistocerca americana]
MNEPAVRDFIRRNRTFDLVICEPMPYQAYYGLFHTVGSPPLVGFVTFSAVASTYYTLGNFMNPAYMPDVLVSLSNHLTFWERVYNTYYYLRLYHMWFYGVLPKQESPMREVFGTEPPSIYETERSYSLLIVGNHFSLEYPRPQLPNVVEITGLQASTKIEKLPKNIQDLLDGADHGVVYCSLGSNVRSIDLPLEKIQTLVEAFRELPQRVIWKWENDSLPSQPDNVMVRKWLTQQSVLGELLFNLTRPISCIHVGTFQLGDNVYFYNSITKVSDARS